MSTPATLAAASTQALAKVISTTPPLRGTRRIRRFLSQKSGGFCGSRCPSVTTLRERATLFEEWGLTRRQSRYSRSLNVWIARIWYTVSMKKLVFVAAIAFIAASCGGDSGGDARVDEVIAFLEEESAVDDVQLTDSENRCLAGEIVAGLDDDLLDELLAGNPKDDPPEGAELVLIESLFDCVDMNQLMVDSMVADGATQEEAECFAGALDAETLETMMSSELTGTDPSPEEEEALAATLFEAMFACGSFDE